MLRRIKLEGDDAMTDTRTLSELRADFGRSRLLAMPLSGTIAWTAAGILGARLDTDSAAIAMFICMAAIFPLGLLIARVTGEDILGTKQTNELDRLFGLTILMANMVWGIAIPFWLVMPASLPLSVGILSGLMWIPLSWMLEHWVGLFHGIARTVLVTLAWLFVPGHRFVLIPAIIVVIYAISIYALATRSRPPSQVASA